jgi:hypothetical protein
VPDFEIRYFHADGTLAIIRMTSHPTHDDAVEDARRNQSSHHRFEVHQAGPQRRF